MWYCILGINIIDVGQIFYVDMFGLYCGVKCVMNCSFNCVVCLVISDVDVVVQVIEVGCWIDEDEVVYVVLGEQDILCLLVINKVDFSKDKGVLFLFVVKLVEIYVFDEIYYVSVLKEKGLVELEKVILVCLLVQLLIYGEDEVIDCSECFFVVEMVCEQFMLWLDQELLYVIMVEIEQFVDCFDGVVEIYVVIWVECDGQKVIVIGQGGVQFKVIGSVVCWYMECLFECKVFFKLWVKVCEGWVDDEFMLKKFGYID